MVSNREVTERLISAWNAADEAAWLAIYAPDAEYHTSGVFPGLRPVYRGHDELALFWRAMHEPWAQIRVDLKRFAEGDGWTVLEFRFRAVGVASDVAVDMEFCNAGVITNGRVTRTYARRSFDEAVLALQSGAGEVG